MNTKSAIKTLAMQLPQQELEALVGELADYVGSSFKPARQKKKQKKEEEAFQAKQMILANIKRKNIKQIKASTINRKQNL